MAHGDTSGDFTKTPGWLDWYDRPSRADASSYPRERWTPTATSSAPGQKFPYAPERKYTPCDARQGSSFSPCATISASTAT